jgi:NADPH:quinone reductase-like Zn-dependent oxidoreductase
MKASLLAALTCMALLGRATAFQGSLRLSTPSMRAAQVCRAGSVRMQAAGAGKGKLLVLGGTGFVGSTVAKLALDRGYEVVSMSRRGKPPADSKIAGSTQIRWEQGDATKTQDMQRGTT